MKSPYAVVAGALAVALIAGCSSSSAPKGPQGSVITIGPQVIVSVDTVASTVCAGSPCGPLTYYTDTIWCNSFNPNPASASTGENVQWVNNSGASVTLFDVSSGNTPIATIQPGATSNAVFWSQAGSVTYTASTCGVTGYAPGYQPEVNKVPQQTIYITAG